MSQAICPLCGARLEPLRSTSVVTLSCSVCGWNRASARHVWKRHRLFGCLYIVLGVAMLVAIALLPTNGWNALPFGLLLLIGGGVIYGSSWRALRQLPRSNVTLAEEREEGHRTAADAFTKLIPTWEAAERRFPGVLSTARPRRIRSTWQVYLVAAVAASAVFSMWLDHLSKTGPDVVGLILLIVLCALFTGIAMRSFSERKLMRLGEVTTGRIVCQQVVSSGRYASNIVFYAFVDATNRPFIGEGSDGTFTKEMREGDPAIVFYQPLDPRRCVALNCCDLKIKLPKNGQT
jgi:hypothetical protein